MQLTFIPNWKSLKEISSQNQWDSSWDCMSLITSALEINKKEMSISTTTGKGSNNLFYLKLSGRKDKLHNSKSKFKSSKNTTENTTSETTAETSTPSIKRQLYVTTVCECGASSNQWSDLFYLLPSIISTYVSSPGRHQPLQQAQSGVLLNLQEIHRTWRGKTLEQSRPRQPRSIGGRKKVLESTRRSSRWVRH